MNIQNPKRIILELSTKCNLRCIMCAQNHVVFDNTYLPLSLIKKLDGFFKTADEVTLFGYGEPLLNKELTEIVEFLACYKNLKAYLLTNGVVLSKFVDLIVRNRLAYLSISIDASSAETYKKIRRGGDIDNLLGAVDAIRKLKTELKTQTPYLRFIFVAMKDNIRELPDLIELAQKYGVSEVKVEYLVAHSPEMVEQSLFFHRDLLLYFQEAKSKARETGVIVKLPPLIGEDEAGDSFHKECTTPFDTFFLSSNGDVRACMISNELFGNIGNETPEAIWEGEKISLYRQRVNSTDPPQDCRSCWQASHQNVNREDSHVKLHVDIAGRGVVK
jgi:radical SAM protein with 4Fe4S-binding SPASM domain